MNEGCSSIKKNRILKPEHPLYSSDSDLTTKIATHIFLLKVLVIILKLEICESQF